MSVNKNSVNTIDSIKLIILDYGRTLYDRDNNKFFIDVKEVLKYLSKRYILAIVSIVKDNPSEERIKALKEAGLYGYFSSILFHESEKDNLFRETLNKFNLSAKETVIIDDRIQRGIKWGNNNGAITIWFRKGKFANELPDEDTGYPQYTIENLIALKNIL